MWKIACGVLILIAGLNSISGLAIPHYIKVCHRTDPHVGDCIKNSIEGVRSRLPVGLPDLGIAPMEPFKIRDMVVSESLGPNRFLLKLTDVLLHGITDFQVDKIKLDIPTTIYKAIVKFPKLRLSGNYAIDVRILAFPITASGGFDLNATDIAGTGILHGHLVDDDFTHLEYTDLAINVDVGDYNVHIDNGMEGDDDFLTEAINLLANKHKEELLKIALPYIESEAQNVLLNAANNIVHEFAYDEIFPE